MTLPRLYQFSGIIKRSKSKADSIPPDVAKDLDLGRKIGTLLDELKRRADGGSEMAKQELFRLRSISFEDFKKFIEQKAKAGHIGRERPIGTLLEIADWVTPLLLWLTEHQLENVKKYARDRWQWPGLIHLCKTEQKKYEALSPKFNKAGTKIRTESPIALGETLGLNINARKTVCDYLFRVAAHAVVSVTKFNRIDGISRNLNWLRWHHKPLQNLSGAVFQTRAENYLETLGRFSRANFPNWEPAFDSFLTLRFGPYQERTRLIKLELPQDLISALIGGTQSQWLDNYVQKKPMKQDMLDGTWRLLYKMNRDFFKEPPLVESELPEIRRIVGQIKKPSAKWNGLKRQLLKRIHNLAPED